jgi:hypothetical protein
MPHACSTPNKTISMSAAPRPHEQTHICENVDSDTAYCGLPVDQVVREELKNCHPTNYGGTHGGCQRECHAHHPDLPL